jgi:hypothetical protein
MYPTKFRFIWQSGFRGEDFLEIIQLSMVAISINDRDEMSNHNIGISIDDSYQASVHLAKWFQRRRI